MHKSVGLSDYRFQTVHRLSAMFVGSLGSCLQEMSSTGLEHTHTRLMARFSVTTRVSRYQKGKTNLDFTEARDSEWQWHQLDHMQVCT